MRVQSKRRKKRKKPTEMGKLPSRYEGGIWTCSHRMSPASVLTMKRIRSSHTKHTLLPGRWLGLTMKMGFAKECMRSAEGDSTEDLGEMLS